MIIIRNQLRSLSFLATKRASFHAMESRDYISPHSYNVLLSDVKHDDLVRPIAERLGVQYLYEAKEIPTQSTVDGILYGTNCRPMINLVASSKKYNKHVNIVFMIDTTSPSLYVSQQAMKALGFSDNLPGTFDLSFQDKVYEAVMSPPLPSTATTLHGGSVGSEERGFHDINLIGASFLSKSHAKMLIDYSQNTVKLSFKQQLVRLYTL